MAITKALSTAVSDGVGTYSFRNRIINGDMRIWQRGTSFTNPSVSGNNFYTADRWGCNRAGDVSGATISRSTSAPTGFQYSLALQRTAGQTGTAGIYLYNSNETVNVYDLAGQYVTLSFWAKAGANYSGGTLNTGIYSGTGTDEKLYAYTGSYTVLSTVSTITTTWTRYTFTGLVPSNATELGFLTYWTPSGTAGADDTVYITGVQLEAGTAASIFERRPYGTELALCQRYYQTMDAQIDTAQNGSSYSYATWFFKTTMRAIPTVTQTGTGVGGQNSIQIGGAQWYASSSALRISTATASAEL